jgi:hypothetical protein
MVNLMISRNKNKHKTIIDWDLNVYCPEQWYGDETYWDHDLWKINARIYMEGPGQNPLDTDYTITLLEKEAKAIGLVDWANNSIDSDDSWDDWLDAGLDGFIDLYHFNELYRGKCTNRVLEFLDTLPRYLEDVPDRMKW